MGNGKGARLSEDVRATIGQEITTLALERRVNDVAVEISE